MDDEMRQLHNTLAAMGVKTEWYYEPGSRYYFVHVYIGAHEGLFMRFHPPIDVDACAQSVMRSLAIYHECKYP